MMFLAENHIRHAFGTWPGIAILGVLLVVGLCVAIFLLTRRATKFASPTGPREAMNSEQSSIAECGGDFDARILAMLSQKGEPIPQAEIAENLRCTEEELAKWLASMERRELIRRSWEATRSTYVVHLAAGR
jgi:hypothetical protein